MACGDRRVHASTRGSVEPADARDVGTREIEPVALQVAAGRTRRRSSTSGRADSFKSIRALCHRIGLRHDDGERFAVDAHARLDAVERVRPETLSSICDAAISRGTRSSVVDDAADQAAAAPRVRQHGKHDALVRHEEEQRLVARDGALVVERDSAAEVADPPAARVPGAERVRTRLCAARRSASSCRSPKRSRSATVDQSPPEGRRSAG